MASVGPAVRRKRDASISPVAYDGVGWIAALMGGARTRGFSLDVSASAGASTLAAATAPLDATEHEATGSLAVAAFHADDDSARATFRLGVMLRAAATVTDHRYANPGGTHSSFLLASAALGPALRWRWRTEWMEVRASTSAQLLGVAHHSYADIKPERPMPGVAVVLPARFRSGGGEISYEALTGGALGLRATYRLDILAYDDAQPVRAIDQAITIGLVTRAHGARRLP